MPIQRKTPKTQETMGEGEHGDLSITLPDGRRFGVVLPDTSPQHGVESAPPREGYGLKRKRRRGAAMERYLSHEEHEALVRSQPIELSQIAGNPYKKKT